MEFAERAVRACERNLSLGVASERHIRDVLRCESVDVSSIEPFLKDRSDNVRMAAVRIVGEKGRLDALLDAAVCEKDRSILSEMLKYLGKKKDGLEALAGLLESKDSFVREAAISMFRCAGKTDCLFPMIFDESDAVVQRIKRYLNEQEQSDKEPGS